MSSDKDDASDTRSTMSDHGTTGDVVQQLIDTAPAEDLRVALKSVARSHSEEDLVITALSDMRRERAKQTSAPEGSCKRKALQTCAGCEEEYDEAKNKAGACRYYRYHPGQNTEPPSKVI